MPSTSEWLMRATLAMPAYADCRQTRLRLPRTLSDVDLRDRLGEVDVPTLILHGRHDRTCDPGWAEDMADRIDGAKLVWLERSAHYPMVEQPDALSTEIAGFVQ